VAMHRANIPWLRALLRNAVIRSQQMPTNTL
jgi:hypothetical protein